MTIERFRAIKDENYTSINNTIVKDSRISLKAKGFLLTVMSLPPAWDFSIRGMVSILKEGREAVYSTIQELEEYGYCHREQARGELGKMTEVTYSFFETPLTGNPLTGNPEPENPPQLNKQLNKELKNKTHAERVRVGNKSAIATDPPGFNTLLTTVVDGVQKMLGANMLPRYAYDEWEQVAMLAYGNGYSADDVLACLVFQRAETWRKSPPTASTVLKGIIEFMSQRKPKADSGGCDLCRDNQYKERMGLKNGEVYDPVANVVRPCECRRANGKA